MNNTNMELLQQLSDLATGDEWCMPEIEGVLWDEMTGYDDSADEKWRLYNAVYAAVDDAMYGRPIRLTPHSGCEQDYGDVLKTASEWAFQQANETRNSISSKYWPGMSQEADDTMMVAQAYYDAHERLADLLKRMQADPRLHCDNPTDYSKDPYLMGS